MNATEYALSPKGTLMMAADRWSAAFNTTGAFKPMSFEDGIRTGECRALSALLTHATAHRSYSGWVEAIIAMDPIGPCGWPPAERWIANHAAADPEIVNGRDCDGVLGR